MKKYKIGYTQGTFDLFHIGHLNLLNKAKEQCDYLIVGVNSDELVKEYKNKTPIINQEDRIAIISAIKCVDEVILCDSLDKIEKWNKLDFNCVFIGDDWKNSDRWNKTVDDLKKYNVDVVFLPHTDGISSTQIRQVLNDEKNQYINANV